MRMSPQCILINVCIFDVPRKASVLNLTEVEAKVYELTNNDPQTVSNSEMSVIAGWTYD
jgi:hypothetical protein